jgi:hypothetical protein
MQKDTQGFKAAPILLVLLSGCGGQGFAVAPRTDAAQEASPGSDSVEAAGGDESVGDVIGPGPSFDGNTGEGEAGSEEDGATPTQEAAPDALDATADATTDATTETYASDARDEGTSADATGGTSDACVASAFYLDGDGDGYGGTTAASGCAAPTSGNWVRVGGDCDDSNATVNPGQTAFFAKGYTPTGKTSISFDYNCDGQETESGASPKAGCQVSNLTCIGSGYLQAMPIRSGPGVDPFCGSALTVACPSNILACSAGPPQQAAPITCH